MSAAAVLALALAGCGSASPPSPPRGVDGLVIPTPDADPADFVGVVDNPWFPLAVGTTWEYDAAPATPGPTLTATVVAGPTIDGVPTTTLVRVARGGRPGAARTTRDHYAQDEDGHVWWFGREGEWRAGEEGAEAGLAMPADPRLGDGFRLAGLAGPVARALVVEVDTGVTVPSGYYRPVVVLEVTEGGVTRRVAFARGVGMVRTDDAGLVAHDEPR